MKQIIINFESEKDYNNFIEEVVDESLKQDKIIFDKETNIMLIKEGNLTN